jgi:phosphonopyruvate decarboxylase
MVEVTDVFEVVRKHRGDAIVCAGGRSGLGHLAEYSDRPKRDASTVVESMGAMVPFGLGLAIAQPDEKLILLDSEGSLLMNLGALVTVAGKRPENFYHFLLDNGCYATTGGQPVPNAEVIDYVGLAREAGYASVHSFDDLEDLDIGLPEILGSTGPVFVVMKVEPEIENLPLSLRDPVEGPRPKEKVIQDLREDLGISPSG